MPARRKSGGTRRKRRSRRAGCGLLGDKGRFGKGQCTNYDLTPGGARRRSRSSRKTRRSSGGTRRRRRR